MMSTVSSRACNRIHCICADSDPLDARVNSKEALRVLLGSGASGYMPDTLQEVLFEPGLVSWPEVGVSQPDLHRNLPGNLAAMVEGMDRSWLREGAAYEREVAEFGRPRLHRHPALQPGRREYRSFVAAGVSRGVFRLGTRCAEKVRLFFTGKKDGGLRLIVNCRRANQHFESPPATHHFSGPGFCEIMVDEGAELWFGAVDVCAAFYQHKIPGWLSELFSMDPLVAGVLGVTEVDGRPVHPRQKLYPQLAVVPQGWKWGLALVQAAHEQLLDSSSFLDGSRRAVDFMPPPNPKLGPFHSIYVDNLLVEGCDKKSVNEHLEYGIKALEGAGLPLHEKVSACQDLEMLGVRQRGAPPRVELSGKRLTRMWRALDHLIERRRTATSRDIERILGHWCFCALLRRPALSVGRSLYDFARSQYLQPVALWKGALQELRMMRGLLVLLRADLCQPVHEIGTAYDACESGHASVDSELCAKPQKE